MLHYSFHVGSCFTRTSMLIFSHANMLFFLHVSMLFFSHANMLFFIHDGTFFYSCWYVVFFIVVHCSSHISMSLFFHNLIVPFVLVLLIPL